MVEMKTYSVIQKSQLESMHRMDAEYYQPEYLDLEKKIYSTSSYRLWGNIEGHLLLVRLVQNLRLEIIAPKRNIDMFVVKM